MRDLNIEFQEQYKRLDRLCRDMYSSPDSGVSAYIRDMENTPFDVQCKAYDWNIVHKKLKPIRWMRNQLAHDISIDSDFCERSDIEWIKAFYDCILNGNDPLAYAHKANQEIPRKSNTQYQSSNKIITHTQTIDNKPRKSIWKRIASKIKKWFS